MDRQRFEKEMAELTEEDAGFKSARDHQQRNSLPGMPPLTLDDYRDRLWLQWRDDQQMIDMGR